MAVLDDIATEKQRIAERLARVDAEHERLAQQLAELDAAERVLSRMAPGAPRRGRRGRKAEAAQAAPQARSRRGRRARQDEPDATTPGRRRDAGRGGRGSRQKPEVPLGDATLQAVEGLGNNITAEQVREYLSSTSECGYGQTTSGWRCSGTGAPGGWKRMMAGGRSQTVRRRRCYRQPRPPPIAAV